MGEPSFQSEFLVLSRGQWEKGTSKADLEAAITKFYTWSEGNLKSGPFKPGSRLSTDLCRAMFQVKQHAASGTQ